jgi:hypothetical protein
MIKKLRRKFVAICMALVTLILAVVFFSLYVTMERNIENLSHQVLRRVIQEDSYLPSIGSSPQYGIDFGGDRVVLPYFTVHVWGGTAYVTGGTYANLEDTQELQAELADANMVIRDLFDARWTCVEHPEMVAPEGIVLEITFDLGVMENAEIFVTTYDEGTKAWTGIVKTVNNGDGTVTCTFEHLCAIAFSMGIAKDPTPVEEPAGMMGILPWILLLVVAVVAVVVILVSKKKKSVA